MAEPCFLESMTKACLTNKKNCYWPNWGKTFQKWKAKAMTARCWQKKAKAWEEILTRFNSQIPNGIKRDLSQLQGCWRRLKLQSKKEHDLHRRETRKTGGGKAPASPSEVSKLVADVLPASINPLEQEFDDDAGEELLWFKARQRREESYYMWSGPKSTCSPWSYWQERSGKSHEKGG